MAAMTLDFVFQTAQSGANFSTMIGEVIFC